MDVATSGEIVEGNHSGAISHVRCAVTYQAAAELCRNDLGAVIEAVGHPRKQCEVPRALILQTGDEAVERGFAAGTRHECPPAVCLMGKIDFPVLGQV